MIRINYDTGHADPNKRWVPAFLVQVVECRAVIAREDAYSPELGLCLSVVELHRVRVARTKIPLLDTPASGTSAALPDAAKGPTKSGLVPCVCGAGGRDDCTC